MMDKTYYGAWDLEEGEKITMTIDRVEKQSVMSFDFEEKSRPIIFFKEELKGESKGMVINFKNGERISKMAGSRDVKRWVGVRVNLCLEMDKIPNVGKGLCLRIDPYRPIPAVNKSRPELSPDKVELWGKAIVALQQGKDIGLIKKHYFLSMSNEKQLLSDAGR